MSQPYSETGRDGSSGLSTVRAADTCLRILQTIAFSEAPLGVTQLAGTVGIAKGATHKHLRTLIDHGMIVQDERTSLYRLGPKIWLMGQNAPQGQLLSEIALPLMRAARDEIGLAVVLSIPTPKSAFVLSTVSSNHAINIGVKPGSELQLHASAQGKIFLAFGSEELRDSLKPPLIAVTPNTKTNPDDLTTELEQIRQQGFAVAPEEAMLGINALAAPILAADGSLVGSIGLIGSIQHLGERPTEKQLTVLKNMTGNIAKRI